jgi:hypothetical protein
MKAAVTISKQDCRWLVRHRPAADVAFTPGAGVKGRRVRPADLPPARQIKLPDLITIPLHVPVRDFLKSGASSPVGASEVGVGLVTVDRHGGEVKYEGRTLVAAEAERLVVACRKLLRGKY